MQIGIFDIDSTIPNLALMKLSTFHKSKGDNVGHYFPLKKYKYDKIYASTIFNYPCVNKSLIDADVMEIGGTGFDITKNLPQEVEKELPDYTLYNFPHSIGFTMRGCRFNCKFCVVPQKEGRPKPFNTIEEIWTNRNSNFIILLDNDFFGNPFWKDRIEEILKYNLKVNFNQGLNIRIITDEQAQALSKVNFTTLSGKSKYIHFAWDRFKDEKIIDAGIKRVIAAGIKAERMAFYVLIGFDTTPEQDFYRVTKLKNFGCHPFVMPYDKNNNYQRRFARWVNHKAIFNSVKWDEYKYNFN